MENIQSNRLWRTILLSLTACGPANTASSTCEDDACTTGGSSGTGSSDTGEPADNTTDIEPTDTGMSSGTTGPMPCGGNEDCTDDAAPLCDPQSSECVSCDALADGDTACVALDPATPVCGDGECVECTAGVSEGCVGETPICDEAENTCVGCSDHGQCGEAACNLFTGACLPSDAVLHVGSGEMFATIGAAVAAVAAAGEATVVVHGNGAYDEALVVDGTRTIAFVANDGDLPRWILSGGGDSQLTVDSDATTLMDGLQVSGNSSRMNPGIAVNGGRAWIDRSRIVTNNGGGIVASDGGELVLRNCFVGGNVADVDALIVEDASADISYSTIGGGNGSFGMARALACLGATTVTVRNSILVATDDVPEFSCSGATVLFTATETAVPGRGNETLGPIQANWFVNYNGGDFHLARPPAVVMNLALRTDGDPSTDIDSDPRPTMDGAPDVAGADIR